MVSGRSRQREPLLLPVQTGGIRKNSCGLGDASGVGTKTEWRARTQMVSENMCRFLKTLFGCATLLPIPEPENEGSNIFNRPARCLRGLAMKLSAAALTVMLATGVSTQALSQTPTTVMGFYDTSCGTWTQARTNHQSQRMEDWALGFASGGSVLSASS
jgi:hypothetical protein